MVRLFDLRVLRCPPLLIVANLVGAAADGARVVGLPESFSGLYGVDFFRQNRETLARDHQEAGKPVYDISGSRMMLEEAARQGIYVYGGVIEECRKTGKLFNTIAV